MGANSWRGPCGPVELSHSVAKPHKGGIWIEEDAYDEQMHEHRGQRKDMTGTTPDPREGRRNRIPSGNVSRGKEQLMNEEFYGPEF
jgi:hypothetical protein